MENVLLLLLLHLEPSSYLLEKLTITRVWPLTTAIAAAAAAAIAGCRFKTKFIAAMTPTTTTSGSLAPAGQNLGR